jgi:uncharacterized SAM-binding protein YcdF (DUF218 family)
MKALLLPLVEPLGFLWTALVVWGLISLIRRHWRAAAVSLVTAGALSLVGATRIPARLLASLERPYANITLDRVAPADAVVMLGGVLRRSPSDVFGFDLNPHADRVLTAVEVARLGKARALVLGGGGHGPGGAPPSEGDLLSRWLSAWQIPAVPVHRLGVCTDTHDEAERTLLLMRRYGWKKIILVTSAGHMRRSEAVFRQLGVPVQCVACSFVASSALTYPSVPSPVPRSDGFQYLGSYLYEVVGWWTYRLRGWV